MERKRSVVLVVALTFVMVAALALSGCGASSSGAAGGAAQGKTTSLVGEWVSTSGDNAGKTITFTDDVFSSNIGGAEFRYAITGDTQMTLTPIVQKNGVGFDDTNKTRVEHFNFDGKTLKLETYLGEYVLSGTPEADKATQSGDTAAVKDLCEWNRGIVAGAMSDVLSASDLTYAADGTPKLKKTKYTDMTFDQMRDSLVQSKALTILPADAENQARKTVGGDDGLVVYVPADNSELKCPSGGTFTTTGWAAIPQSSVFLPVFTCSVHGEAAAQ